MFQLDISSFLFFSLKCVAARVTCGIDQSAAISLLLRALLIVKVTLDGVCNVLKASHTFIHRRGCATNKQITEIVFDCETVLQVFL